MYLSMARILLFLGSLFLVGCSTYQSLDYNNYIHYTYQEQEDGNPLLLPTNVNMVQVIDTDAIVVTLPDCQPLPALAVVSTEENYTEDRKTTDYPFSMAKFSQTSPKQAENTIVTTTSNQASFGYASTSTHNFSYASPTYSAPKQVYNNKTIVKKSTNTGNQSKKRVHTTTHSRTIIYDPIVINPLPTTPTKKYTRIEFAILQKSFGGVLFHPILPKQQIRMDDLGEGHFGASRHRRSHAGVDLVVSKGDTIFAPIDGVITRKVYPYGAKKSWRGCELTGVQQYSGYKIKVFYIKPIKNVGNLVKAGEPIGVAQSISTKYSHHMIDHIHIEVRKYNHLIDPVNIFQVNDVHSLF